MTTRAPKVHNLKSWVGLFEPIAKGEKTHELRVLDRDYQVGDFLFLREWDPVKAAYTGRQCGAYITYITSGQHSPCAFSPVALHPATGVLSIKLDKSPDVTLESLLRLADAQARALAPESRPARSVWKRAADVVASLLQTKLAR